MIDDNDVGGGGQEVDGQCDKEGQGRAISVHDKVRPPHPSIHLLTIDLSISGKCFVSEEFVHKHLLNKHAEKIEAVRKIAQFYNNYIKDPKRKLLPRLGK